MMNRRLLVVFLLLCGIGLTMVGLAVYRAATVSREEFLKNQLERRLQTVADAKAGRAQVTIDDAETLEMLARDPQCVANVTSVIFVMADLNDARFGRLKDLRNVTEVGFYECENVDNVLSVASEMGTVEELYFEVTRLSDESIQTLTKFPKLKKVRFEQVVADDTIDDLNKLLPNVDIETPYPASGER
jgi:hypothetical protein